MKNILNLIVRWLLEVFSILVFPFSVVLGALIIILFLDNLNLANTQKTPIVIYEHWLTKNNWHIIMKRYLENKGYRVYWTNFSMLRGGADEGAKHLQKFMRDHDIHNAVLVGISLGAVSAFSYLQRYDGWERINKFVSIAGPFKGTSIAFALSFLKGGRQILPNSPYLRKLLHGPLKHNNKILCISAAADELVPRASSMLPTTRNIVVDVTGHNVLHIFSKDVFDIIAGEANS